MYLKMKVVGKCGMNELLHFFPFIFLEQNAIVYDEVAGIWREKVINEVLINENGCFIGVKNHILADNIAFVELRNVRLIYAECSKCFKCYPIFNTHFDCQM